MIRLKILLQSNYFYLILIILCTVYVVICTVVIKYESKYDIDTLEITGVVNKVEIKEYGYKLEVSAKEKIIVYLYSSDNCYECFYGKTIKFIGEISVINNNTIPNIFNYKNYLYNNKIYYRFNADSYEILDEDISVINSINLKLAEYINKFESSKYLYMLIMGNKMYFDDSVYEIYQDNGIAHLLAISGLHIGIFINVLEFLLTKLNKNVKVSIIVLYLLFYLILTNFLVSVLRCFIYYILKIVNEKLYLNISNIRLLILSAIIILIINPFYIYDIGFLYSFVITFFIMNIKKSNIINISIISFLASLPITINMNYEINIFSVIFNIIFVPFVSFIIYPLILITFMIPFLDNFLIFVINIFEYLNNYFNKYYSLFLNIPKMNMFLIILYYIFLYFIVKKNYKFISYVIFIIVLNKLICKLDNNYYIYYLDVGQGDSSLLISPYQKEVILIDTGGNINYNVSDNVILFLKSIGITKLDLLVLTHGDYDHVGETQNINNKISVKNVMFNNNNYNDLELEILKLNINVVDEIDLNYFKGYNLNTFISDDENDSSIVLNLYINNISLIFPGDVSSHIFSEIVNEYGLRCDILKISHHGAKDGTSEELIKLLDPKYSVISVGRNNLYAHPNKDVINMLNNVKIYRTDNNGTIKLKISEKMINFFTYEP